MRESRVHDLSMRNSEKKLMNSDSRKQVGLSEQTVIRRGLQVDQRLEMILG